MESFKWRRMSKATSSEGVRADFGVDARNHDKSALNAQTLPQGNKSGDTPVLLDHLDTFPFMNWLLIFYMIIDLIL